MRILMTLAVVIPAIAAAQRSEEIRLARSAAPAEISKDAKVYVLENNHYVVADPGRSASGEACVVTSNIAGGVEPQCGDAEADATILTVYRFRTEERLAGKSKDEIKREVDEGFKSGRFHAPTRPALVFMESSEQLLGTDPSKLSKWEPHVMVYYPSMKNSDMGLMPTNSMSVPIVVSEGTPFAGIIVVARDWVNPASTQ